MDDPRIFMVLGALFAFFHVLKIKKPYSRLITWTCIGAVAVMMISVSEIAIDGYYLFAIVQLGIVMYAFSDDQFSTLKKIVLVTSAVCTFVPMILFLGKFSMFNEIALLSGLIQISVFVYALTKIVKELKEEIGFLVVLSAFAAIHLIGGILFFAGI